MPRKSNWWPKPLGAAAGNLTCVMAKASLGRAERLHMMKAHRVVHIGIAVAALLGSFATVAHAILNGTVKTAPYRAAPTLGTPALAVLAVLLVAVGMYVLRRTRGGAIAKVAVVAALAALAGLAYASNGQTFTVMGAECGTVTVFTFDLTAPSSLSSDCPNPIQIIDLKFDCTAPDPPNQCMLGEILTNGQTCNLPLCVG